MVLEIDDVIDGSILELKPYNNFKTGSTFHDSIFKRNLKQIKMVFLKFFEILGNKRTYQQNLVQIWYEKFGKFCSI